MTERKIEVGDVVRLNSGGPHMTVEAVGERVEVSWPALFGGRHVDALPAACLTIVERKSAA